MSFWSLDGFVEIGSESFEVSVTLVFDTGLVILWVPHEGWVAFNVDSFSFVFGGIELGNDEVLVVSEGSTELFPDWEKLLAVTTPWGVVLDEDILGWVHDDLLEFSSDNSGDWSVVVLWDWVGFEMWLDGTGLDIINPFSNGLNGEVLWCFWGGELGHLLWDDASEGWKVVIGDSH